MNSRNVQNDAVILKKGWKFVVLLTVLATTMSCTLVSRLFSIKVQPTETGGPLGLIAYVGTDGNIYTIDRDGKQKTAITQDANLQPSSEHLGHIYMYPTWAPNGYQLAFMGFTGPTQNYDQATLYTVSSDGKKRVETFNSKNSFPFYLFWSPNSKYVTFLSNSSDGNGLTLNLSPAAGGDNKVIDTGQPLYWDWSPDNQAIITHTGGAASDNPDASLAFYRLGGSIQKKPLALAPGPFQAPAWSPSGNELILETEKDTGGEELVLAKQDGTLGNVLAQLKGPASFAWSPKGNLLAYTTLAEDDPQGLTSRLILLDPNHPEQGKEIAKGVLLAFFWSPDSEKIAYFMLSPKDQQGETFNLIQNSLGIKLAVQVYDLSNSETKQVSTFAPTDSFIQIFPYFDQYQRSGTIWSPDSKNLVLAGFDDKDSASIFVVNVGDGKSQKIADGDLAFWSWK